MNTQANDDVPLPAPFAILRAAVEGLDTPPGVEKELMQAFARQFPRRRWYHRLSTPRWSLGASVASAALVVLVLVLAPRTPQGTGSVDAAGPPAGRDGGVFIALDSLERIEREARPRIVEAEVPRTALAPLGVAITPENAGDSVKAEMLVAANGHPLALRLTSLN